MKAEPHTSASSRHAISVLLVAAAILANLAALTFASLREFDWRSNEVAVILGLAFAQSALAAAYFVWGRWNVVFRAGFLLVFVAASWRLGTRVLGASDQPWLATVYLFAALATVVPLLIGRLAGLHLAHHHHSREFFLRTGQFRLWDLFSWTTAIAILAAAAGVVMQRHEWNDRECQFVLAEAAIGCGCFVSPLYAKRIWVGVLAALAAACVFGMALASSARDPNPIIKMTLVQGLVMIACAVALRLGGYRLCGRVCQSNQCLQ